MIPNLPDKLAIQPFTKPARGDVTLPGSKSLTNRLLILATLMQEEVTLTGALFSEDTHLMVEALRKLGFTVEADDHAQTLKVSDQAKGFPDTPAGQPTEIFVGLAGTAARFLTALCAAAPRGVYRIDGIPQMRKRPMKGLIDALRQTGVDLQCLGEEGFFPIEIRAHGLRGGAVTIDASESSQMLSALLMVGPLAQEELAIKTVGKVRLPFVDMTSNLMTRFFGVTATQFRDGSYQVLLRPKEGFMSRRSFAVEPDATAASYFLALPLVVEGSLYLPALIPTEGLQGDTRFMSVLREVGASIRERRFRSPLENPFATEETPFGTEDEDLDSEVVGTEVTFDLSVKRKGVTKNFSEFSDTFLTLAAIAPLLEGPTRITGIAHTRKQETDRVAGMVAELRKLGQEVEEHADGDGLTITPRPLKPGVEIETYGDHRFAMSFAILGCHDLRGDGSPWLTIKNPACCAKTFPNFFDVLESIRKNSHSVS